MRLIPLLLLLPASIIFSCKNEPKTPASPVVVTMSEAAGKKCVQDTICADLKLSYPVLSGGSNPNATQAINDSLLSFVYMVIGGDPALSLPQAFDSAVWNLYYMLQEQVDMSPDFPMGFSSELKSTLLFQNDKLVSVEMATFSFTGGAHGNYGSALNTFLLSNGKSVQLTDIVQDTAALRPLLEKAFVAVKGEEGGETYSLDELVFPENLPLSMPMQWCVVKEGLRVTYNPYEVAPYAVGQTDIVLTWEQLGNLADSKKWLD
jgi:Deacetylase PdaC/Protein of unknown function (DUF3298)